MYNDSLADRWVLNIFDLEVIEKKTISQGNSQGKYALILETNYFLQQYRLFWYTKHNIKTSILKRYDNARNNTKRHTCTLWYNSSTSCPHVSILQHSVQQAFYGIRYEINIPIKSKNKGSIRFSFLKGFIGLL